jgi:hypothetical protein
MTSLLQAKSSARQAHNSKPVELLARLGLAARGVVYVVVGVLALQVALGRHDQADRNGALGAIREQPFGKVLLVVLAIGFAGYAVWRLLEAAVGHRDEDGAKRAGKRATSLFRAGLYGWFAWSTVEFLGNGSGKDKTTSTTAHVMTMTGGRWVVGAAGVGVFVGGVVMAWRGLTSKCVEKLDLHGASDAMKKVAETTGLVGLTGRGLVFCLIGGFLVESAWTFEPRKAKGLDAALKSLAGQPFGTVMLVVAAVGLAVFGLWSFVESRYRDV